MAGSAEFDFIIVGAGSAGCVLAERLTANGSYRVLLLEAGGSDRRFYVQMPLGYGKTFYDPSLNWMYRSEPDPGLNGQTDYWPRGKILGGSSSINAMVYIRGHAADYDDWKAAGNPGWGWDEVLAAYRAMEDNEAGGNRWRGKDGPLQVSHPIREVHPLTHRFIEAAERAGLRRSDDFNGEEQEGAGIYQLTTRNGIRLSSARAFLRPAMRRANLAVRPHAHVTRILFEGRKAVGVEYASKGSRTRVLARREIVLAGGAINSPQLLQLSGIGPGALLNAHGIGVLIDNPNAGANLEDHVGINYTFRMTTPTLNDELRPWWGKLRVGLRYLLTRRGPLCTSVNHGGGFFRTNPALARPNMQLYMQAFSTLMPKEGERPVLSPDPFSGLSLGLSNCRPTSRGTIAIRSPDPFAHPKITANAYSTDHDVSEMLLAVKFLRTLAAQEPLAGLIAEELRPGPDCKTDDQLIHDFRQRSGTVYHPSCTCKMGPDPSSAVVDSRLRVHGTDNLRVCDTSIFPNIISGNTNAPAMMAGWKGAALILEDAK
jgi:choline dehydrogenase